LLPISIFEGCYSMNRLDFFSQLGYGCLFAVGGTLMTAFMLAACVKYTGDWGWHPVNNWREALAYSAFIADVDPVATLAVFNKLAVDPLRSTLVTGESTLNDPVALVMFGIANVRTKTAYYDLGEEIGSGVGLLVGSIAMGCASGLVLTACFKLFRLHGSGLLERLYLLGSAYACFDAGEMFSMSGIIVCLFGGLVMGIYCRENVKEKEAAAELLNNVARLADIGIFIIIGISVFLVDDLEGLTRGVLPCLF